MKKRIKLQIAAVLTAFAFLPAVALAADDTDFTQQINNGTLSWDITDSTRTPIANPAVTMDTKSFSFDCQTSTKTFSDTNTRIYIMDGDSTPFANGWALTLAASDPADTWLDGTKEFDFNDPGTSGCTDSAGDTDTIGGQLTVTPGTPVADCDGCTTAGVSPGSAAGFDEGGGPTGNNVTLMSTSNDSPATWRGWIPSTVSQKIPARQAPGNYALNLVLTGAAQ